MKDEKKLAEKIKQDYMPQSKEVSKIDQLKNLDKKVKQPVNIFSYTFGSVGSLVLGTGMCLAMGVIGGSMPLGIVVGLLGIAMVSTTYPLHNKLMQNRKNKYADEVLQKSNEILKNDYQLVTEKELNLIYEEKQNLSQTKTTTAKNNQTKTSINKDENIL